MSEQEVLNVDTWPAEAEGVVNDIKKHVNSAQVSSTLKSTNQRIYINLTTLENTPYCIELSPSGFRIVGRQHDDASLSNVENIYYETPYALLNIISKKYKQSFGGELMNRLLDLAKQSKG